MLPNVHPRELRDRILSEIASGAESVSAIAKREGISRSTVRHWVRDAKERVAKEPEFTVPELPEEGRTAEEILEARKAVWKRKQDFYESRKLIDIAIHTDGPVALAHFGDPHLDDDGADIDLFKHHMGIVRDTEGLFAGTIGDVVNNWCGKLAHLHGMQTTTAVEAWKLAEWVFGYIPWLYILGGNHEAWSGDRDPVKWITKHLHQPYVNHGTRLRLNFPNGRQLVVNVAHDFKGHSQWNPVHGPMKKAFRWADDIFVCGHKHHTGLGIVVDPATQKVCWTMRVDSYKVYDDFPKSHGIDETYLSPCIVTILNPDADSERDKVIVCLDPEQAADILTDMRARWKSKQKRVKKKAA